MTRNELAGWTALIVFTILLVLLILYGGPAGLATAIQGLDDLGRIQWLLVGIVLFLVAILLRLLYRARSPQADEAARTAKDRLALIVIYCSFGVLTILLLFSFWLVLEKDAQGRWIYSQAFGSHSIQLIGLILPVLGTWVGTVLAFYFARENFEAAQAGAQGLGVSAPVPVTEVMLPFDQLKTVIRGVDDASEAKTTLKAVRDVIKNQDPPRAILLSKSGAVRSVIHSETIDHYLVGDTTNRSENDTIETFLKASFQDSRTFGDIARGLGFVSKSDTLMKCQSLMEQDRIRNVFVTENGRPGESPVGLVTDDIVRRRLRV